MLSSEDFPDLDTNGRDKQALQESLAALSLKATPADKSRVASVGEPSETSKMFRHLLLLARNFLFFVISLSFGKMINFK